jgi:AcrR family transcriptional regulator
MTAVEPRKRRPTGEPRRLILAAARDLFSRRGYSDTSTRELADHAAVSETLIFRYFGSKAVLFREALVVPFVEFVDDWAARNRSGELDHLSDAEFTRGYITDVYELFRANRGLLAVVWAADANEEHVLAESGVLDEVTGALAKLVEVSRSAMAHRHPEIEHREDLGTRAVLAVSAGMAAFGRSFYGGPRPSDDEIIDEVVQLILHGYLYTSPSWVRTKPPPRTAPRAGAARPFAESEERGARPPA